MTEGFFPKAAAIYKKLLKLTPDDERAQLNLAAISQKQGLLADAKARLNAVAAKRRGRGDRAGLAEIVVILGSLDPADFEARTAGARTLAEMGRADEAAARFRGIYEDLVEKERPREALDALREAVDLNPQDQEGRATLARIAVEAGDFDAARRFLNRETAGDDPALQMALVEMELKAGRIDQARELLPALLAHGRERRQQATDLAWSLAPSNPDAAFVVVEAIADAAAAQSQYGEAAVILKEFVARVPRRIPALLKLVDACVAGGLEAAMQEAQAELADAYLAGGQASEARLVAEDLVAREPWERAHIERFRRALVMLKVDEPDVVIAQRLGGNEPFTVRDVFASQGEGSVEAESGWIEPAGEEGAAAADGTPEAPAPPAEAPPPGWEPVIDRSGEFGPPPIADDPAPAADHEAFAAVFGQPGQPAAESEPDSAEDHLTLGRTYLEMSMPDEAIEPLKEAFKAAALRFDAAALLARLYQQRGDAAQAIEWFERAAGAPAPSRDDGHAVLYELGALIEASGDTARALALFLELQADASSYRDVAERVERLARVETGG
jgi:tetratricopeptide (TPR) repeat protein